MPRQLISMQKVSILNSPGLRDYMLTPAGAIYLLAIRIGIRRAMQLVLNMCQAYRVTNYSSSSDTLITTRQAGCFFQSVFKARLIQSKSQWNTHFKQLGI